MKIFCSCFSEDDSETESVYFILFIMYDLDCTSSIFCTSVTLLFQVTFEGVRGAWFTGDIALDDILMKPGKCTLPGKCVNLL